MPLKTKRMPDGPFYRDLGRNLRAARAAAGKTQLETAEYLDVTFQQIQKYENGINRIPVDRLVSLAAYLEVPLVQFVAPSAGDSEFQSLASKRPDSVVCLNVLEHIKDDRLALSNMDSILGPGGKVILIVPAFKGLYGPIDANLGHYRRYGRRELAALAGRAGLKVRRLNYMNSVGFIGWWMNARVLPRQAQSESQIMIFDRLIVPVMSRIESVVRPPFGQSIFAVLEK